jgi:hypothetical protein
VTRRAGLKCIVNVDCTGQREGVMRMAPTLARGVRLSNDLNLEKCGQGGWRAASWLFLFLNIHGRQARIVWETQGEDGNGTTF